MKRRILSSLMALVLVFGLLPVSAMAKSKQLGCRPTEKRNQKAGIRYEMERLRVRLQILYLGMETASLELCRPGAKMVSLSTHRRIAV